MSPTYYDRTEVAFYADAWAAMPEGIAGSPLFAVRFTPAGLLAFMDLTHAATIEAVLEPTTPPVTAQAIGSAPDSLLRRIEAREAPVASTEARGNPTGGM